MSNAPGHSAELRISGRQDKVSQAATDRLRSLSYSLPTPTKYMPPPPLSLIRAFISHITWFLSLTLATMRLASPLPQRASTSLACLAILA